MIDKETSIAEIRQKIQEFSNARGWTTGVNPKDLAMALSVETAELLEIFQWVHCDHTDEIVKDASKFEHLKEEVADVFWYLIRICEYYKIDLATAVESKAEKNAKKYPETL